MPVLSAEPILPRHRRWDEFIERVCLAYFADHGGCCDCEVVFNVGPRE